MKKGACFLMLIVTISIARPFSSFAAPVIINSADTVVFDLSGATCTGGYIQIPVSILSDDTVYTLDFSLRYNHTALSYDSLVNRKSYLNPSSYYNPPDSTLRFTGWSLQQIENNTPLIYIYFNLLSGQINSSYLNSISAFLNGDPCSIKVIDAVTSGGITAGGSTSINPGDSVALIAPAGSGYSYSWSTGSSAQSIYARSAGTYSVAVTNTNGCSTVFSIDVSMASTLPVELLSFNAEKNDEAVFVSWATASEINNDYFTVERSSDGNNFQPAAKVKGAGNSSSQLNYSWIDSYPLDGISYYRLRQTDFDLQSVTSKTIAVDFYKNENNMINIYPNPASGIVYVNISWQVMRKTGRNEADFVLRIFDVNGREIRPAEEVHLAYGMLHPLDVSTLSKGVYIVQLAADSFLEQQKLVIE